MSDDLILADAIYAAGQALHVDACTEGDPHDGCDCGDWDREAEIAVRAALPSIEHQLRELIAQAIRRLRADVEQVYSWAHQIADRYGDDWPHEGGCMGDPADSGCPLCRLLAVMDGGE